MSEKKDKKPVDRRIEQLAQGTTSNPEPKPEQPDTPEDRAKRFVKGFKGTV